MDSLQKVVQEEKGIDRELLYGATCGKSRQGKDNALIWYYTDNGNQKNEYFPVEVEVVGEARYKYRFGSILETSEPATDIATAVWLDGICVFVNNPDCVTVEVIDKNGKVWNEKNEYSVYPMIYYYDFESASLRFLDADGNEIK